jgi:hypothetical protein
MAQKPGCARKMLDWRLEKSDGRQEKTGKSPHRESALYFSE